MTSRTSFTTDAVGRRIVAKVARGASEAALLEREAALLAGALHPGVVELIGIEGHGLDAMLLTVAVDGPSLRDAGPLRIDECTDVLAGVASTLADLHELGIVHGSVSPDHVLLGPGRRPVLCGLGHGGRIGQVRLAAPTMDPGFADPAFDLDSALDPAIDLLGLGALAAFLASDAPPGHVLRTVAADGMAPDPRARPAAAAIADRLRRGMPSGLPAGSPAWAPTPEAGVVQGDPLRAWRTGVGREARRRLPVKQLVAVGLAIAGLAVATMVLAGRHDVHPASSAPGPGEPAGGIAATPVDEVRSVPTTTRVGPTSTTAATPVRRDCPPVGGLLQADVDGDGCPEALRYAAGILESDGARWSVGKAGDQVATGDWGCQGQRTAALFRPSTGEVFRFDAWADPGADVTATVVGVVAGGQALRAADVDHDGCHEVVVERPTGPADVIRFPRPQP